MPKYQFDKWNKLYSKRANLLKSSAVRDLLAVTARPDIISLAGGLPYTRSFKMEKIVEATRLTMERQGNDALQYGPSEGHIGLKTHIVNILAKENIKVNENDFIITGGSQQALDLIGKVFIDPGDLVFVEAPSYVGALNAFVAYQPRLVGIPLDDQGLRVDVLVNQLQANKKQKPKFLYLVPNFHNPAGVTLSLERRKQLLQVAKDYNLLIIEDNPYGFLRYSGDPLPALRSLDENVVYISTFSKIFSPGIRLGWALAPHPILEKLTFAKQSADLCSSSFTQRVVEEFLNTNNLDDYLAELIQRYRRKRDIMLASLLEYFPKETSWTKPDGGFFIWVKLPSYLDTTEMLAEAIAQKVAYVPGKAFFADGSGANFMRLCFSYPKEDEIKEGIKRLAEVISDQMALYQSLTKHFKLNATGLQLQAQDNKKETSK